MAWFSKQIEHERATTADAGAPEDPRPRGPLVGIRTERMREVWQANRDKIVARYSELKSERSSFEQIQLETIARLQEEMSNELKRLDYEIAQTQTNLVAVDAALQVLSTSSENDEPVSVADLSSEELAAALRTNHVS